MKQREYTFLCCFRYMPSPSWLFLWKETLNDRKAGYAKCCESTRDSTPPKDYYLLTLEELKVSVTEIRSRLVD